MIWNIVKFSCLGLAAIAAVILVVALITKWWAIVLLCMIGAGIGGYFVIEILQKKDIIK